MQLWTYDEAKADVEQQLDIEGENVIGEQQMMRLFNLAINEAESVIHSLFENYFLTSDYVELEEGISSYAMPSDIYANKLRHVVWVDGNESYEVVRIKVRDIVGVNSEDQYRYNVENASGGLGTGFVVYPTPRETTSVNMRRWYVRNANTVVDGSSVIDIPEFIDFVLLHVRYACALIIGHPAMAVIKDLRDQKKVEMRETLQGMVEDGNDDLEMDASFYDDSVA